MSASPPLPDLHEAVEGFERAHFSLAQDLRRLAVLRDRDLPEASVLYAARVLEVLVAHLLVTLGLRPVPTVLTNLHALFLQGLLPHAPRYAAHAIRRAGNEARHVTRPLGGADAAVATALLEAWLEWHFCRSPYGPRVPALTRDGGPLGLSADERLARLVGEACRAADPAGPGPSSDLLGREEVRSSPSLAGILVEALLDRGAVDAAGAVLDGALDRTPDDPRLRQLAALRLSRSGALEEAREAAEALLEGATEDEEALGICGGVLKRLWQREPERADLLRKAHRTYRDGWRRSRKANAYLGVNAAATAWWLGRTEEAAQLARAVDALLAAQEEALRDRLGVAHAAHFWAQATRAEALLLLDRREEARTRYRAAVRDHAHEPGLVEVALRQAEAILRHGGREAEAAAFVRDLRGATPP